MNEASESDPRPRRTPPRKFTLGRRPETLWRTVTRASRAKRAISPPMGLRANSCAGTHLVGQRRQFHDCRSANGASLFDGRGGADDAGENGAWRRIRTTDTRIFNPLLYQLSYPGAARRRESGVYRRAGFGCPASVSVVLRFFIGTLVGLCRDDVGTRKPTLQIDVGAATRAERSVLGIDFGFPADGTKGHGHASSMRLRPGAKAASALTRTRGPSRAAKGAATTASSGAE